MLIKGFCLGAVLVSTPLCLLTESTPERAAGVVTEVQLAGHVQEPQPDQSLTRHQQKELKKVRRELAEAKRELADMRRQLGEILDTMDAQFAKQQHRSCAPSRNRALMSHYQWLDHNGHDKRAEKSLNTIVAAAGKDVGRLNSLAWDLMTDKDTVGKFDRVALALADQMEKSRKLRHHYIDTIALARFLNGQVDRAVDLQKRAIAAGGNSDDYRRRLRTYEAAQEALLVARQGAPAQPTPGTPVERSVPMKAATGTVLASANEEDEE